MTPEKFFDYLEGKLSPEEREDLERALISDPELQRQFVAARRIHRSANQPPNEAAAVTKAASRGRLVAAAFAVLVLLNVGIGLYFIFRQAKPPEEYEREKRKALLAQIEKSVNQVAAANMSTPRLGPEEIQLTASAAEKEKVVATVIAAAERVGGSATRDLPNDKFVRLLVDLPASRAWEFRAALAPLGAVLTTPAPPSPTSNTNETERMEVVITTSS